MDQRLGDGMWRRWWDGSTKLGGWNVWIHGLKQKWLVVFLRSVVWIKRLNWRYGYSKKEYEGSDSGARVGNVGSSILSL